MPNDIIIFTLDVESRLEDSTGNLSSLFVPFKFGSFRFCKSSLSDDFFGVNAFFYNERRGQSHTIQFITYCASLLVRCICNNNRTDETQMGKQH